MLNKKRNKKAGREHKERGMGAAQKRTVRVTDNTHGGIKANTIRQRTKSKDERKSKALSEREVRSKGKRAVDRQVPRKNFCGVTSWYSRPVRLTGGRA